MKVNDLTHIISSNMPVFPGTEQPILEKVSTIEKDGFRESKITMCSHTGTHVDSPAHMLDDGNYLDELSIENFIGSAIIVDFSNQNKNLIEISDFKLYDEKINQVDFIILKTGWSKYWGQSNYYKGFPSLSEECAKWLSKFNLKGIGIDAISIDSIESTTFPIHKILMKKNIIIIENLTNIDSIINESFILSIMPLKNKDADGSPVRAISIENI
ncbi:cyclase family protein [Clostridium saccharobutylicum]|uniref:Kynurenine formamidase n=1 Tax=Clostridium saccharobutylicum DSM 13864 TaxID=1345695 RepID=U5MUG8_CLOSA|nr:cyclase family protein [Clostridium saccharobutylicum]AGX44178.1 cyclase family protein [Clostridium saccharobutylicum DSM 13864]AQR91466.1 kynurenine formamidase [Clostridium saccharobutylicum]AQS01370.1 kynurenine formamidase [Clostridium saccharobutylicum]AQS10978.1 kynurenine formamidase [Clostridium saccharobutylicum]AQS15353.1 kynurenine formamidase [Clostridium saccharobutylicum]